jgi:outer membrane protein, multidrug efflux system
MLEGCAVGPNYRAPAPVVSETFARGGQTNFSAEEPVLTWWLGFHDRQLNELIDQAIATNQDLRIATARLREARALRRQTRFDLFPVPAAGAGYENRRLSQAAVPALSQSQRESELYDVGFDATWELDIFGRVRRSVQAATAEVEAAEATRRDVQVSLVSEVARNYFELRGLQNELDVARRSAVNQRETLQVTQGRLDGGRGTELDVARARAQLNSTLAGIPPLEAEVARALHRLSVLTGRQPSAVVEELEVSAPLPDLPPLVAIGKPEDLLRRRPDVRAAERGLAAATARVGMATADLFPRVTFNGRVALEAETLSGLGGAGSESWSFGPRLTWAALDLGHVRARIQAADARTEAALANYERTVLTALEETENALVDFGREQVRRKYLDASAQASATAVELAHQRFDNGATDFLTVLDAERVLLEAQDRLAQSQTRTATALVAVYKSLGGGWEYRPAGSAKK